jgi:hypothetical protein
LEAFNKSIDWVPWVLMQGFPGAFCVNVYYIEGHWFVEQEMLTIPEYMSSLPGFQWISCCSTCVMLRRSLFFLFPFACPSIYSFWLPLWYLKSFLCTVEVMPFLSRNCISISRSRSKNCLWKKIHFIYKISDICK